MGLHGTDVREMESAGYASEFADFLATWNMIETCAQSSYNRQHCVSTRVRGHWSSVCYSYCRHTPCDSELPKGPEPLSGDCATDVHDDVVTDGELVQEL